MRIKLSAKFFFAFLVTSLTIVALMVVIMQIYADRAFSAYVHKMEIFRLDDLTVVLSEEYRENNGWERLKNNRRHWQHVLRPHVSAADKDTPPHRPNHLPPLPPQAGNREPVDRNPPPGIGGDHPPDEDWGRKELGPPWAIEHRLTLFDAGKQFIVGASFSPEDDHTLREITIDGVMVGWLGMRNEKGLSQSHDIAFIKGQAMALYTIGAISLLLAATMAFLLSRHLLAPVQQLIDGARALTSRDFSARIEVRTGDELGRLAEDFNKMFAQLEHYELMRRQWISDISHELRTPLSILRGEIEAMQDGIRPIDGIALASLHAESLRLGKLVDSLHDLSMADSGMLHMNRLPLQPDVLLRNILKKYLGRLAQRHITIIDELGELPLTIMADEEWLSRIFCNLLENTVRYTESPGVLKVRQERLKAMLIISFEDSGPGVPEASLSRLFDRLYRVDPSRSRDLGGAGLGLAICRQIVQAHDGEIKASRAPTGGLLIEIALLLSDAGDRPANL
ncbi:MAG: ATP-binding protein [Syntrophus sp. (in: bacteria)]